MESVLKNIVSTQFGFYHLPLKSGEIRYLQVKDFNETGQLTDETDNWLNFSDKSAKHLLQSGDILFTGKGFRNFAWVYTKDVGPSIASSIFFVLRPNQQKVLPEYLATVLNTEKYKAFFLSLGAGSTIPSIRKEELGAVKIPLPSLAEQEKIVALKKFHQKSIALTSQILEHKNKIYQTVINHLINA